MPSGIDTRMEIDETPIAELTMPEIVAHLESRPLGFVIVWQAFDPGQPANCAFNTTSRHALHFLRNAIGFVAFLDRE